MFERIKILIEERSRRSKPQAALAIPEYRYYDDITVCYTKAINDVQDTRRLSLSTSSRRNGYSSTYTQCYFFTKDNVPLTQSALASIVEEIHLRAERFYEWIIRSRGGNFNELRWRLWSISNTEYL